MGSDAPIQILLVSYPAQGHINPLLRLAKCLAAKGSSVIFITTEYAGKNMRTVNNITDKSTTPIGDGSLTFQFFDDGLPEDDSIRNSLSGYSEQLELVGKQFVSQMIKNHADSNKPISCIINNPFFPWVCDVAYDNNIPSALLWIQSVAVFVAYYNYFHKLVPFPTDSEPYTDVQLNSSLVLKYNEIPDFLHPFSKYPFLATLILEQFKNLSKVSCVLVDTYEELEHDFIEYVSEKSILMRPVGPLFNNPKIKDVSDIRGDFVGFGGGLKAAMLVSSSLSHVRPLTCASSSRLVSHPHDLVKWVTREGGFVHRAVKIAQLDSGGLGLGLVAKEEIPVGSELIVLPQHLPLQFTAFQQDRNDDENSLLLQLSSHVPDELWAMKLGLKLLHERAKVGSFWWPYISNLPETYTLPIFFPGEDIKNLQYAPVLHQVNKRCRFLLDFEKQVKRALVGLTPDKHPFSGQELDASSLGWAMSAVSSRAFKLHGNKNSNAMNFDIPMMLPLIDMCNHSFDPNARIVQEQETGSTNMRVKVVAEKVIKQDDPLLLCYGCLNNDLFLLDYGFVIQSNPYDCIELRYDGALLEAASTAAGVSSPNFSTPAPWQELILSQLNLSGEAPDLKVSLGGEEIIEGRLLAALRVLLASDMEAVQKYDLNILKSLDAEAPLGVANDIAVFRTLIALCVVALGHFPTKLMDDESLLKQGASGSTELAIQFRIQKKSIIIDVMKNLARKVKVLSSNETVTAEG